MKRVNIKKVKREKRREKEYRDLEKKSRPIEKNDAYAYVEFICKDLEMDKPPEIYADDNEKIAVYDVIENAI